MSTLSELSDEELDKLISEQEKKNLPIKTKLEPSLGRRTLSFIAQEGIRPKTGLPELEVFKSAQQGVPLLLEGRKKVQEEVGKLPLGKLTTPVKVAEFLAPRTAFEAVAPGIVSGGLKTVGSTLKFGQAILKDDFTKFVSDIVGKSPEAVRMRIKSVIDPFSKDFVNKNKITGFLSDLGKSLLEKRNKLGSELGEIVKDIDKQTGNAFTIGLTDLKDKATSLLTNRAGQQEPVLSSVIHALTPVGQTIPKGKLTGERLVDKSTSGITKLFKREVAKEKFTDATTFGGSYDILRNLRKLISYDIKDPNAVKLILPGSNAERVVKGLINDLKTRIHAFSESVVGKDLANKISEFHELAEPMGQLSKELLGKGDPETKLFSIMGKEQGSNMSRLETIASKLPELEGTLSKAKKVFVSSQLAGRLRRIPSTGAALAPSGIGGAIGGGIGALLGGPGGAAVGGMAGGTITPLMTLLAASPRYGTEIGRSIYQGGQQAIRATQPARRFLANPVLEQLLTQLLGRTGRAF